MTSGLGVRENIDERLYRLRHSRTMRLRSMVHPILIAAPLTVVLITGCSTYGSSSGRSEPSVTCSDVLGSVVHRERTGDTAGAINSQLDWLSKNCSTEYDTFVDYASARGMAERLGPDICLSLAQHIGRGSIALLSEDGLCSGDTAGSLADGVTAQYQPGGGIAWNEAATHAGTTQRVCGPLFGTGNSNDDVFLDLGRDYPDPARFQIVLWDVGTLDPIPAGATLCTSGQVTLYEGVAQIELRSANLVEIYK